MHTFMVPCLLGLEKLVGDEIRRLGLKDVQVENGRVLCRGELSDLARLNINLRCGARVLLVLGRFPARSFEELFQGTRAIPWEEYLPRDAAFPVKGYSISSQLHAVPACQSIIKKAMVERMKAHYGLEQFPEDGVKYQVRFSLFKDEAMICLDSSGEGLYKRGYRAVGVEAPLRETLAAAMVTLSRFRGRDPFCDPFCGSGTICIEAALIAMNRAPGLDRSFDAQRWGFVPSGDWLTAAGEAMDKEFHGRYDIWGGDVDPRAVAIARDNARKAGVEDVVRFEVADMRNFRRRGPGHGPGGAYHELPGPGELSGLPPGRGDGLSVPPGGGGAAGGPPAGKRRHHRKRHPWPEPGHPVFAGSRGPGGDLRI